MTTEENQAAQADDNTGQDANDANDANQQGQHQDGQQDAGHDDYRGKLNAQNRFLEGEGYKFEGGKWVKPVAAAAATTAPSLSAQDIIALRDVHEEDIGSIQDWAKFKGVSLAEARKDRDLNIILGARAEERRTAAATQTSGGSRGATKPSGADLLAKAIRTNEVPEDDEGMEAIAAARTERSKKKA